VARYDWYILRVWHSGRRPDEQWAARLEAMPDGECRRFNQPDLLLAHLRTLIAPANLELKRSSQDEGPESEPDAHMTESR
jgi:hypothetical protein